MRLECERSKCEGFCLSYAILCNTQLYNHKYTHAQRPRLSKHHFCLLSVCVICVGKWQMWINQLKIGSAHINACIYIILTHTYNRNYICCVSLRSLCERTRVRMGDVLGCLNVFFAVYVLRTSSWVHWYFDPHNSTTLVLYMSFVHWGMHNNFNRVFIKPQTKFYKLFQIRRNLNVVKT